MPDRGAARARNDWLETTESEQSTAVTEALRGMLVPVIQSVAESASVAPVDAIGLIRRALDELAVNAAKDADQEATPRA